MDDRQNEIRLSPQERIAPLQILIGRARESDVRKFAEFREKLSDMTDKVYADAILWACSEANEELFRRLREDEKMNGVLREIMKDDLIKERQEGHDEGRKEGEKDGAASMQKTVAERMIDAEKSGDEIELFTSLSRGEIDSLARLRNRTVRWETTASA